MFEGITSFFNNVQNFFKPRLSKIISVVSTVVPAVITPIFDVRLFGPVFNTIASTFLPKAATYIKDSGTAMYEFFTNPVRSIAKILPEVQGIATQQKLVSDFKMRNDL